MPKIESSTRLTPFEIAREALGHVGRFNTPPTPSVYEVWYRYVEGVDDIIANLSYAVEDANAVSADMLDQLHRQYCLEFDDTKEQLNDTLASEMSSLQTILEAQMTAGRNFGNEIDAACDSLSSAPPSAEAISKCAEKMLDTNNAMQENVQQLQVKLQESQAKVDALQNELSSSQKAVMTDPLTGLGNRRHFDHHMARSLSPSEPNDQGIFLLIVDLDHFKYINDTFGHDCGDKVIRYVAEQLTRMCPDCPISRLGGDEFAIILSNNDYIEAKDQAAKIRHYFASTPLKFSASGQDLGKMKLSIGGARRRQNDDATSWFIRADKLLYQAKNSGRNNVMLEHLHH